jgi:hypothetical protein
MRLKGKMDDQLTIREMRIDLPLDDATLEGDLAIPENPRGMVIFRSWQWQQPSQPAQSVGC